MQKLLISRRHAQNDQQTENVEGLSPEKYGGAAYSNMTFTPSKLADNVLYRQTVTLRKFEQGSNTIRELEADNCFLRDKIVQLEKERDGIENSLTQQIIMYKQIVHDLEKNYQTRIKQIQAKFKLEIRKLIEEKEIQVKFWQAEKEILENRIEELEEIVKDLQGKVANRGVQFEGIQRENERLKEQIGKIDDKIKAAEDNAKEAQEKARKEVQSLQRTLLDTESLWKDRLERSIMDKNKELQDIQRGHRADLDLMERRRDEELRIKNDELRDMVHTFQCDANRMNDIINARDRVIDALQDDKSRGKAGIMELTKNYQTQINTLVHEKRKYMEQCELLSKQLEAMALLGQNNPKISHLTSENQLLSREIRSLKEVLMESSQEIQRCREEFLKMGREKDQLLIQLKNIGLQNQTLLRVKRDRQQEAETWRSNYFRDKRY